MAFNLSPEVAELIAEGDERYSEYAQRLIQHIAFVREAGRKLGLPDEQMEVHDQSKWEYCEFEPYARRFDSRDVVRLSAQTKIDFMVALIHHYRHNPHHWQSWVISGYKDTEPTVLEMPEKYALEMVADWMGASLTYGQGLEDWLTENWLRIRLHPETRNYVRTVLWDNGYEHLDILMSQGVALPPGQKRRDRTRRPGKIEEPSP